jgi:hypothetical protein
MVVDRMEVLNPNAFIFETMGMGIICRFFRGLEPWQCAMMLQ